MALIRQNIYELSRRVEDNFQMSLENQRNLIELRNDVEDLCTKLDNTIRVVAEHREHSKDAIDTLAFSRRMRGVLWGLLAVVGAALAILQATTDLFSHWIP